MSLIIGTAGNDSVSIAGVSPGVTGGIPSNAADEIAGLGGDDVLFGAGGDDSLVGGEGNDNLGGGDGNDTVEGGSGDDTLQGAAGADVLNGGDGTDTANYNTIFAGPGVTVSLALSGPQVGPGHAAGDVLLGIENLTGSLFADVLTGDAGRNVLEGLDGDDTLGGGAGDDVLLGGTGADSMSGGAGDDTYEVNAPGDLAIEAAGGGFDTAFATASYVLPANVEAVIALGSAALDLTGNADANVLVGNAGANVLTGGDGNDLYGVNGAFDTVVERPGGGYDETYSSADYALAPNVETLFLTGSAVFGTGNDENNALVGNGAGNVLSAGAGTFEFLNGAGGDDILIGGTGHDEIMGGAGADLFRFTRLEDAYDGAVNVADFLYDFTPGVDRIQLNAAAFGISAVQPGINFVSGAAPSTPFVTPALLYSTTSGLLFWDDNGAAAGGVSVLAVLNGVPNLSAADISFY